MRARQYLFWIWDFFHGSPIRRHYTDIKSKLASNDNSAGELQSLLKHASSTTPFYKCYEKEVDLSKYPIINKAIIKEHLNDFISEKFDIGRLTSTTTSGSTGTPFTIYKDSNKVSRHQAAVIFFNEKAGLSLGQRLYYFRVWNKINKKNGKDQFMQNIIPVEISRFDENDANNLMHKIRKYKKPASILGFASALTELSRLTSTFSFEKPLNLKSIISMSEHLPEATRKCLQEQFCCSVVSRYSNMENGFIAQQVQDSDYYTINTADFKIELLNLDNDEPVKEGELGRVVITDLYNYAMPLIRYDTGDTAVCNVINNRIVFKSISGRITDLITNSQGQTMSPHIIANTLWEYKELQQYQFIQRGKKNYTIRLSVTKPFLREENLKRQLLSYLGKDAEISFEYVNEIPVLQSGKRRSVINEWTKK